MKKYTTPWVSQIIVENQARSNAEFLAYAYGHKLNDIETLDKALHEGSIRVLVEATEFNENEISAKIEETRSQAQTIISAIPDAADAIKTHLKKLENEMPQGAEISGMVIANDKSKLKEFAKRVVVSTEATAKFSATIISAFSMIGNQFKRFSGKLSDQEQNMTLSELATEFDNDQEEWKGKFVSTEQLAAGLKNAYVEPAWYDKAIKAGVKNAAVADSFLGKVWNFFSGLKSVGDELSSASFTESVLSVSFNDFMTTVEKLTPIEEKSKAAAVSAAEATTELTAAANDEQVVADKENAGDAPAGEPTGEDAKLDPAVIANADKEAENDADALGKTPVSKKKLTALLKKPEYANITGKGSKATVARRKLRLAINDIANKEIFEEGILSGPRRTKKNDNIDTETFNRWKTLAGID